jgi:hypothetical protein
VLVALGPAAAAACATDPAARADGRCPRCGGWPQLSFRAGADDPLVAGRRTLACARCGHRWAWSGSACPACGGTGRVVHAERREGPAPRHAPPPRPDPPTSGQESPRRARRRRGEAERTGPDPVVGRAPAEAGPVFAHLRVDACSGCARYLIDVDLGADPRAVPEVDELAAVPLALYAADHGLSKITPNLMGF